MVRLTGDLLTSSQPISDTTGTFAFPYPYFPSDPEFPNTLIQKYQMFLVNIFTLKHQHYFEINHINGLIINI